jgi:hypothetical protein
LTLTEAGEKFAKEAFDNIKAAAGDKWDNFTDAQKDAAKRSAARLVELSIQERQGITVTDERTFIEVTVNGFKLAGQIALYDAFWEGLNKALEALGSFLAGVGKGLLPGV